MDTGLFLNDRLIEQEGATIIDALVPGTTASGEGAFAMSDDGWHIHFEGALPGGTDGAAPIDLPWPAAVLVLLLGGLGLIRSRRQRKLLALRSVDRRGAAAIRLQSRGLSN
jgi:hypothetical protein